MSGVRTKLKSYNPTDPDAVFPALADISACLYNDKDTDPLIKAALVPYQFENAEFQSKNIYSVYEYIKRFPITSVNVAEKRIAISYNTISKIFSTFQNNKILFEQ